MTRVDAGLTRLVDGVLLPGFSGSVLPRWLEERLGSGLAGVFVFGQNVVDRFQLTRLTTAVHELSPAAIVASDEEGGTVTRVEHREGSSWPGAAALGRLDDVAVTERLARAAGEQCRGFGINLVAAPVADVNADPDNPVIGIRSFGADPELVARQVAASVRGFQAAGVAACAKHWPGHGSTRVDSHLVLPVVDDDEATVRRRDLPPFAAAVAAGVRCVMTAHVRFPAFAHEPATVSRRWTSLLRSELGFAGVLISDALDMGAVANSLGRGEAAVRALGAGVDLLCIGNPEHPHPYDDQAGLDAVRDALLIALADGRLPAARLEEAAGRVRELGAELNGRRASAAQPDPAALRLAHDVVLAVAEVRGCLRLPTDQHGDPHVLDLRSPNLVAADRSATGLAAALRRRAPGTTEAVVSPGDQATMTATVEGGRGPVVALVDAPHRHPRERELLAALAAVRPDAVVVQTGLGDGAQPPGERWLRVWGSGRVHAEVAADLLLDRSGGA